jgi:hypothetical protein
MSDRITVTIHDDHLANIDEIVDQLRAAKMQVDQVLRPLGVITGSIVRSRRSLLDAVPGVAAVEDETSFQLPPPDAEVQ